MKTLSTCVLLFVFFGYITVTVQSIAAQTDSFDIGPNSETSTSTPMSPEESAASVELPEGFHCTLVASEPMVRQPISMTTDSKGRLWIGENYTYSENSVGYHASLRDRIVILEDHDGDGKADESKVFFDQAERLTSIEIDHDGVWAICLPQLIFIPDRNHDDKPDGPPEVILDGFEYIKARHTVANGLRWGPDGWLYGRQGILGTSLIGPPGTEKDARTEMNVGIWRFHPLKKIFEVVAVGTTNPWGMDWNEYGEPFFINTVIGHLWHIIPGAHYRRMFGDDANPHVYELIEQHADHVHWATNEVWTDVRKGVTDATFVAGGGHAHTGLLIYQGGVWPEYWKGKLLTINFHGRKINVENMVAQGSGYVGRREPDRFHFSDAWFRGIDLIAAPDGNVYVSDWSDTGECHDHDGIHRSSGRIFKISYGKSSNQSIDWPHQDWKTLSDHLTSDNVWVSRHALREINRRLNRSSNFKEADLESIKKLLVSDNPIHQIRSLWALSSSSSIDVASVSKVLQDTSAHENVRICALRILHEIRATSGTKPSVLDRPLLEQLVEVAKGKTTPALRLAIASVLQKYPPADRSPVLAELLKHDEDASDHNLPLMLWYATFPLADSHDGRFEELIANSNIPTVSRLGMRLLLEDLEIEGDSLNRIDQVLGRITQRPMKQIGEAILDGIAEGASGRRTAPKPTQWESAAKVFSALHNPTIDSKIRDLNALFGDGRALEEVRFVALNELANINQRLAALQLLIDLRDLKLREICEKLIRVRGLSATAAMGLSLSADEAAADLILSEWPALYGHERPPVVSALVSRPAWSRKLLLAIKDGKLNKNSISVFQARQVAGFHDKPLTELLRDVWGKIEDENGIDRNAVIAKWKNELSKEQLAKANLGNGRDVFKVTCSSCHILNGVGAAIGPELTGASRDNLDYLLDNILFPNAVVPDIYRQTILRLNDDRVVVGIVRSRSRKAIKLQTATELVTIPVSEIEEEKQSNQSIMPTGVLETLSPTQRIDLLGYLMSRN